jgi:hypothetical protein
MGNYWLFVTVSEFDFSHDQSFVVAMKFVNFEGVIARTDEPAGFVDKSLLTERHHLLAILEGYLLFKLIAREPAIERGSLDGDIGTVVAKAYTYRFATVAAEIALADVTGRISLVLVR